MNDSKKVIFTDPTIAARFIAELEKQEIAYVIENTSLQGFVIRVFITGLLTPYQMPDSSLSVRPEGSISLPMYGCRCNALY